jgi:HTH-type transcriptional regulator/antitoxin HigA
MAFEPHLIQDDQDRAECLAEIHRLTASGAHPERIALLEKLAEIYEQDQFRASTSDPVDAILTRMRQRGLRQAEVAKWLGGRNRASEVLSRKRPLSLAMIEAIARELRIPLDILVSGAVSTRRRKREEAEARK